MEKDHFKALKAFSDERASTVHDVRLVELESGFRIDVPVGFDDSEVLVSFIFNDAGDHDGVATYDVDTHIENREHAGLVEQVHAMQCAVAEFERQGWAEHYKDRTYYTVGMS